MEQAISTFKEHLYRGVTLYWGAREIAILSCRSPKVSAMNRC